MNNPSTLPSSEQVQESVTSITSETKPEENKKNIVERLLNDPHTSEELLGKVKWLLSTNRNKNGHESWNEEAALEKISGTLRGMVTESLSSFISLTEAETVYESQDGMPLQSLRIVTPQEFSGSWSNKKGDVLSKLMEDSLKNEQNESTISFLNPSTPKRENPIYTQFLNYRKKNGSGFVSNEELHREWLKYLADYRTEIETSLKEGYTFAPDKKRGTPGGEFYESTVIPDGLILDGNGKLVGFVEVKGYTTEEFGKLCSFLDEIYKKSGVTKVIYEGNAADFGNTYPGANKEPYTMGADLAKESEFTDIARALSTRKEESIPGTEQDAYNLVVLRLPSNIPDNLINSYGEKARTYGFFNVIIQRLPFTAEELDDIGRQIVNKHWQSLTLQLLENRNFSNRELGVLEKYRNNHKKEN